VTKSELISAVAEESGLKKAEAEKAISAFISAVTSALKQGDKLALVGFGTFCTSTRAARTGKNPQTGDKIEIPSAILPKFKPGKALKDAVNEK
jgi:DNA-binding protein HU-beta